MDVTVKSVPFTRRGQGGGSQAVPNSADDGKVNRADRRRLRLLVSISAFCCMAFGRPVKTVTTSWI